MPALTVLHGVRTVQLTRGRNTLIDEDDYPLTVGRKWSLHVVRGKHFYATGNFLRTDGRAGYDKIGLHVVLSGSPKGCHVDHRNGDGLDNRRANIRVCSAAENIRNIRRPYGASEFKGIYCESSSRRRPWRARIKHPDGRRIQLGAFATEREAAEAYDLAARELYGEFACTNAEIHGWT